MKKLLVLTFLCLVALLALLYSPTLLLSQPILQQPIPPPDTNAFPWGTVLLSGLSAAIITIGLTRLLSWFDNKQKRDALIIAFAYELVLAYHRCVIYYVQCLKTYTGTTTLSYSRLFDYTDISLLATYATTKPKPDIVAAIAYLKAVYFQIAKHVEEAANYVSAAEEDDIALQTNYTNKALRARDSALAFFRATYYPPIHEDMQNKTLEIIDQIPPAQQKHLLRIFDKAKEVKAQLDPIAQHPETIPDKVEELLEKLEEDLNKCLVADEKC